MTAQVFVDLSQRKRSAGDGGEADAGLYCQYRNSNYVNFYASAFPTIISYHNFFLLFQISKRATKWHIIHFVYSTDRLIPCI